MITHEMFEYWNRRSTEAIERGVGLLDEILKRLERIETVLDRTNTARLMRRKDETGNYPPHYETCVCADRGCIPVEVETIAGEK